MITRVTTNKSNTLDSIFCFTFDSHPINKHNSWNHKKSSFSKNLGLE